MVFNGLGLRIETKLRRYFIFFCYVYLFLCMITNLTLFIALITGPRPVNRGLNHFNNLKLFVVAVVFI